MLSQNDNCKLTETGPSTLMGNLFRNFWLPALLVKELPAPDCPPKHIDILGEPLLAFRDSNNKVLQVYLYVLVDNLGQVILLPIKQEARNF